MPNEKAESKVIIAHPLQSFGINSLIMQNYIKYEPVVVIP